MIQPSLTNAFSTSAPMTYEFETCMLTEQMHRELGPPFMGSLAPPSTLHYALAYVLVAYSLHT